MPPYLSAGYPTFLLNFMVPTMITHTPDRILPIIVLTLSLISLPAGGASSSRKADDRVFSLSNGTATCTVTVRDGILSGDALEVTPPSGSARPSAGTDAGFAFEIMWTDWQAPGKNNNAENPVVLGPRDFFFRSGESHRFDGTGEEVRLTFAARESPLKLVVTYRLEPNAFYVRRKLSLSDSTERGHFLAYVSGKFTVSGRHPSVLHRGGFGQPVALLAGGAGVFFGVEYPAADNTLAGDPRGALTVSCRQEMGMRIMRDPVESNWTVFGVTPDPRLKYWFFEYVNRIRVAPLAPYALYNSWYDLRAPEMVADTLQIMNEANVLRMVRLIRENMIRKHGIHLDAFVLDDGWDVYKSDWALRSREFPRGLKPISDALAETETRLGIWFGPIGGYSHSDWRVGWMTDHGYEAVNNQLCLAGANYSRLFRERTTDFVRKDGVRYFKWDGIQFSCSEPAHGHPVGIYSRRAVLESLIDKCAAVRAGNPDVYLNITSGTWLSPWWVQYANQIWMQGADYGYADVPSFSKRDAAMTYRDLILYDDFTRQGYWFPIANLMTVGIIKGNLERLGSAEEPLEKFTDDVLLCLARGISMYELYISPDLLVEGEWKAISEALLWARDRFPVLSHTAMIGGDPGKRQPYGYTHWKGNRGIVAARNPWIDRSALTLRFDAADGLDAKAAGLVLERVYPTKWISPRLYRAGDAADLPLEGFETAVYEIYPLAEAARPLVAGVRFDERRLDDGRLALTVFQGKPLLLNPKTVSGLTADGVEGKTLDGLRRVTPPPPPLSSSAIAPAGGGASIWVNLDPSVGSATVALLVTRDASFAGRPLPRFTLTLDGVPVTTNREQAKGSWDWYLAPTGRGNHELRITLPDTTRWKGTVSAWVLSTQEGKGEEILCSTAKNLPSPPMPPRPWPSAEVRRTIPIGTCAVAR
jgi:hypothetical protein